jgi:hypothetical protein
VVGICLSRKCPTTQAVSRDWILNEMTCLILIWLDLVLVELIGSDTRVYMLRCIDDSTDR